ncbi:MAG: hypothetical protein GXO48_07260 [Chlorobi bacterium]|nr:hypothetical protein [Chlorobiota bacterium]
MREVLLKGWFASLLTFLILLQGNVFASHPNYPVLIKTTVTKKTLSKKYARPVAVVVKDVFNDKGELIIPKGSQVYGILRNNRKKRLVYVEFLYATDKNGRKIPVRGYIVGKYLHTADLTKYALLPLVPFFLVNDLILKYSLAKSRMIKRLKKEPREIWIATQ